MPDFLLKTVVVSIEKGPYVGWIVLKAEGEEEASSARVVTCSVGETGALQDAAPVATQAALTAARCYGTLHTPDLCLCTQDHAWVCLRPVPLWQQQHLG